MLHNRYIVNFQLLISNDFYATVYNILEIINYRLYGFKIWQCSLYNWSIIEVDLIHMRSVDIISTWTRELKLQNLAFAQLETEYIIHNIFFIWNDLLYIHTFEKLSGGCNRWFLILVYDKPYVIFRIKSTFIVFIHFHSLALMW